MTCSQPSSVYIDLFPLSSQPSWRRELLRKSARRETHGHCVPSTRARYQRVGARIHPHPATSHYFLYTSGLTPPPPPISPPHTSVASARVVEAVAVRPAGGQRRDRRVCAVWPCSPAPLSLSLANRHRYRRRDAYAYTHCPARTRLVRRRQGPAPRVHRDAPGLRLPCGRWSPSKRPELRGSDASLPPVSSPLSTRPTRCSLHLHHFLDILRHCCGAALHLPSHVPSPRRVHIRRASASC